MFNGSECMEFYDHEGYFIENAIASNILLTLRLLQDDLLISAEETALLFETSCLVFTFYKNQAS